MNFNIEKLREILSYIPTELRGGSVIEDEESIALHEAEILKLKDFKKNYEKKLQMIDNNIELDTSDNSNKFTNSKQNIQFQKEAKREADIQKNTTNYIFKGLSESALSSFKRAIKLNVDMIDYAENSKTRKKSSNNIINNISEVSNSFES